jgi:hypothetical protein
MITSCLNIREWVGDDRLACSIVGQIVDMYSDLSVDVDGEEVEEEGSIITPDP